MKDKNMRWIVITAILLVAVLGVFLIEKAITSYVVESNIPDKDWLRDNCECTEYENLKCRDDFELVEGRNICMKTLVKCPAKIVLDIEGACKTETQYTMPLESCSQYNCSGKFYNIK